MPFWLIVWPLDPLLAKLMHHSPTRAQTVVEISEIVKKSSICGPPTNLDFLLDILRNPTFVSGITITKFLDNLQFNPPAIDVLQGGAYTLIQDYPGRPTIGRGFGHAGPMDPIAFQIANALVGNGPGKEGLEITLSGPDLLFLGDAIVAITGAPIEAKCDGEQCPLWSQIHIKAGQRLTFGKTASNAGCRSYLSVHGGFPNVAEWFGSKATCPMVGVGGYQGRALKSGDFLRITERSELPQSRTIRIPPSLWPEYSEHWILQVLAGPYDEGYLLPEDDSMIHSTVWQVSHNAARGGIRLIGPKPKWARCDGGEGGSHPSNLIEYGYPIGTLNWTGDEPVIFPVDCPDFGGFVSSLTITKSDFWKVGQLKAGNTLKFQKVTLEEALRCRRENNLFIENISEGIASGSFSEIERILPTPALPPANQPKSSAILHTIPEVEGRPLVTYRQGGDDFILVEYGTGRFDLNHKCRATALKRALEQKNGKISFKSGLLNTVGCGNSLLIYYDGLVIPQKELIEYLCKLEDDLGDLREIKLPNRTFKLPLTFEHKNLVAAIERYMANQRPYASYIPDTFDFVARNNGMTRNELKTLFLEASFVVIGVGFFTALPQTLPANPLHRLNAPKMNPSRTFTPEGTVSWGGSCMSIYTVDSPGGYQLAGLTVPGVDILGYKKGFSSSKPWLFEDMDVIQFIEVSEEEYDRQMAIFRSGRYQFLFERSVFDMKEHNLLLDLTKDKKNAMSIQQKQSQDKMLALEKTLLDKWASEKSATEIPLDSIQALLDGR